MPIYEYECKACGHRFDTIQKFSDAPLTDCPKCAAAELRKLISAPAFRLKGGGWYETDFKSGDKRNLAGDGSSSGGAGAGGGGDAASPSGTGSSKSGGSETASSSGKSDGASSSTSTPSTSSPSST